MSKEAGIIEDFSPDDETPEILADLSDISESLIPDSTPNNQSIEAQKDNPFALNSLPHMRLTQERLNSQSPTQPWREYSGLKIPVLGQFSGLGHQNSPIHK